MLCYDRSRLVDQEQEVWIPGTDATRSNEPPRAALDDTYEKTMYLVDLWRKWYANLSDIDRFDMMFEELPVDFRIPSNLVVKSAIESFGVEFAKDRWDIKGQPTPIYSSEEIKAQYKESKEEKTKKSAKVSAKTVDNNSISDAQAFAEINSLVDELEYHEKLYYDDNSPEISDYEFDMKMKRLEELEKQFPQFKQKNTPTERVGSEFEE